MRIRASADSKRMKIDPTSVRPAAAPRRLGSTNPSGAAASDFAKSLDEAGAAGGKTAVAANPGLGGLTTVLALQETPDALAKRARQRAKERGDTLLDQLEEIRLGLLLGVIPLSRLEQLAQLVRAKREVIDDPRLESILDEIEVRAAVELAKLALHRS